MAVCGSQAETPDQNSIYIIKFSDLGITQYDDDMDVEADFVETDPVLNYCKIDTIGGVNKIISL